jgi:hypothetical protein
MNVVCIITLSFPILLLITTNNHEREINDLCVLADAGLGFTFEAMTPRAGRVLLS